MALVDQNIELVKKVPKARPRGDSGYTETELGNTAGSINDGLFGKFAGSRSWNNTYVDLTSTQDIGIGTPLYFFLRVVTNFVGADSKTIIVESSKIYPIPDAGNAALKEILKIELDHDASKGHEVTQYIPYGSDQRYLRARVEATGSQTGEIECFLSSFPPAVQPSAAIFEGVL